MTFKKGHALIVAVANYADKKIELPDNVLNDGKDTAKVLNDPSYGGYPDSQVNEIYDHAATRVGILQALDKLAQRVKPEDTAVIFFSGHGGTAGGESYLVPADWHKGDSIGGLISGTEFKEKLEGIPADRMLVVLDCCHSGGIPIYKDLEMEVGEEKFLFGIGDSSLKKLAQGKGRVVMSACREDELSWVGKNDRNSLFTHYFLEGIMGNAHSRGDGLTRVLDLFDYVSNEVPRKGKQHPVFKTSNLENNFPVALHGGGSSKGMASQLNHRGDTNVNKTELRETIADVFTLDELATLCMDIQQDLEVDGNLNIKLNLDRVSGTEIVGKSRELIRYLESRKILGYLVRAVRRERPGVI